MEEEIGNGHTEGKGKTTREKNKETKFRNRKLKKEEKEDVVVEGM